jgi:glycosyltransferase involved in cell wall biosynthesis
LACKILYNISNGLPSQNVGGGNRIIYELLSNGIEDEFSAYFFSFLYRNIITVDVEKKSDNLARIRFQKKIGNWLYNNIESYKRFVTSDFYQKKYFNQIEKYIQAKSRGFNSFDIIHSHDTLAATLNKNLTHPKKILTIHSKGSFYSEVKKSFENQNRFTSWLASMQEKEKQNFLRSDLATFPSKAAERIFLEDLRIEDYKRPKTEIVYNGIDLDRIKSHLGVQSGNIFSKYGIQTTDDELKIMNVAQHVKEKNINLLIKSVEILKNFYKKKSILINIGQGPLTEALKKMCNELFINDKIFFLGNIPNVDVIKFLRRCDFLAMTGEKIIFDMVILEAMAAGTSVIASKTGGNLEVIVDLENGYFIEPLSAETLAEILIKIVPGHVRDKAIKTAERFSKPNMLNKYRYLYRALLNN